MSTAAECAARGAALLDEKLPGWAERINLAELELSSCYRCVLGQLFAHVPPADEFSSPYSTGMRAIDVSAWDAVRHGFDGDDADDLNAEWRRVITARRTRVLTGATT